jgi:acetyl-CoA acetyltransferase
VSAPDLGASGARILTTLLYRLCASEAVSAAWLLSASGAARGIAMAVELMS